MTPTPRTLRSGAAGALLAAVLLAGCTDEQTPGGPSSTTTPGAQDVSTSSADTAETTATTGEEVSATSSPAEATTTTEDDSAATSQPPTAEADALTSADDAFTVEIPREWEEALDLARENVDPAQQDSVVLAAKDRQRRDEFFTNVVVTQEEYVGNLTSAVEKTAKQLAGEDGTYEILDPVEVDGNKAPGYTVVRTVGDTTVHQTQRWISHEGTLYSVTFSVVDSQVKATQGQLDDILATWRWTD